MLPPGYPALVTLLCYADESGDANPLRVDLPDSAPLFVLAAVTVPQASQKALCWDFLNLKKVYNPSLCDVRFSELVSFEIKGSTLRRDLRSDSRNRRRRATHLLSDLVAILEDRDCQIFGQVVVKNPQMRTEAAIYASAVAEVADTFEAQLAAAKTPGLMVLDARTKVKNAGNVHGITSRRFRKGGDQYPHLLESPVFGHSDTHIPLQVADLIASALIFPLACSVYCRDWTWNVHPHPTYDNLRSVLGSRLSLLEARYLTGTGRRGGFSVRDEERRPAHLIFRA